MRSLASTSLAPRSPRRRTRQLSKSASPHLRLADFLADPKVVLRFGRLSRLKSSLMSEFGPSLGRNSVPRLYGTCSHFVYVATKLSLMHLCTCQCHIHSRTHRRHDHNGGTEANPRGWCAQQNLGRMNTKTSNKRCLVLFNTQPLHLTTTNTLVDGVLGIGLPGTPVPR